MNPSTHAGAAELQAFDLDTVSSFAIVGVSRPRGFGNLALRELRARGYQAVPVNSQADTVDGEPSFRSLEALPAPVDAVIVVVQPEAAEKVVADCVRLGVKRVWLQQGSQSEAAVRACRDAGVAVVAGTCILMHTRPTGMHRFHRWLWHVLGKV